MRDIPYTYAVPTMHLHFTIEFNDREREADRDNKKLVRNKTDYIWLALFYTIIIIAGEHFFPQRTSPEVHPDGPWFSSSVEIVYT